MAAVFFAPIDRGDVPMTTRHLLCAASLLAALATGASAQQADKLGKVTFPTSCDPKVQAQFERGVAQLHSYWFIAARKSFEGVLAQDPSCAMAYWGIAVDLLGNTLAFAPSAKNMQEAWEMLEKARAAGAKTERERDWIEALSAYFRDHEKIPIETRMLAYNNAMERITHRYPNDAEAWTFYALTLQASAPKDDKSYANQRKSTEILERQLQQNPEHPGVAHFLIHGYDYPPLAEKGLPAARRYAGLAPAAPHARHMPSHIYSMLGLWEDSIASNHHALEIQPDYYHASDFIVHAHLQLGQDAKAKAMIDTSTKTADTQSRRGGIVVQTALAAMPARYALERGDWAEAAALPVISSGSSAADSITRFARGLGAARSGDVAGAKREIEAIAAIRTDLEKSMDSYWATRSHEQALAVSGWVALAEGNAAEALKLMRAAADGEDAGVKHVAMENRLYPLRELLADMLLETKEPAAALHEYEAVLHENPNRYRAFWGAARAAEAAGDRPKAAAYYGKLVALTKNADTPRPELAQAKARLAQQ
jgi:tetratricopeptide (TPR) repeat protein